MILKLTYQQDSNKLALQTELKLANLQIQPSTSGKALEPFLDFKTQDFKGCGCCLVQFFQNILKKIKKINWACKGMRSNTRSGSHPA